MGQGAIMWAEGAVAQQLLSACATKGEATDLERYTDDCKLITSRFLAVA